MKILLPYQLLQRHFKRIGYCNESFKAWQYLPPQDPSGNTTPDTSRQRESVYLLLAYF
ncbi:MAG: hypothetical protein IIT40_09630 [Prevotella sp.]|nr:hypothetical protein [Prevotella sp.]